MKQKRMWKGNSSNSVSTVVFKSNLGPSRKHTLYTGRNEYCWNWKSFSPHLTLAEELAMSYTHILVASPFPRVAFPIPVVGGCYGEPSTPGVFH